MPRKQTTLEMFYEKDGYYYLINPIKEDHKYRKHFKKTCPGCNNFFIASRIDSQACSDKCRSINTRTKNVEIFNSGHYIKGNSKSVVEMFTKSGNRFLIDNEDLDSINRLGWTSDKDGYITTKFKLADDEFANIKLHRYIMKAKNSEIVDHIDGDVTNNTKSNLRIANKSINGLNQKNAINCYKKGSSFVSRVSCTEKDTKKTYTKSFKTANEAINYSIEFKKYLIDKKLEQL